MPGFRALRRLGLIALAVLCISALAILHAGDLLKAYAAASPELCLLPSESLVRGLQLPVRLDLAAAGISRGSMAVDFTLEDASGRQVSLSALLKQKPVVLILGSYT